jgi:hypothetical protein
MFAAVFFLAVFCVLCSFVSGSSVARSVPVTGRSVGFELSCSLAVRSAVVPGGSCCLWRSASGRSLSGGVLVARSARLRSLGVLF